MAHEPTARVDFALNGHDIASGSVAEKVQRNVRAIELLRTLEQDERAPVADEQLALAQYVGWGGAPSVFDEKKDRFTEARQSLQELLSPSEWQGLEASTPNAHYTPPDVARLMWAALERLGFEGGAVLEPAAGSGNFLATMPRKLYRRSEIVAVEPEPIAAGIMRALYPSATVLGMCLEDTSLQVGTFDVAISNVPFGNYAVSDQTVERELRRSIHDYFFVKMLDLVRPGGIVAAITSRFTMDKRDDTVRRALAERADLLGSVRLPYTAFEEYANTRVTTDVVFLRRRGGDAYGDVQWVKSVPRGGYHLNEYYAEREEMMLGKMVMKSGPYGEKPECVRYSSIRYERDLEERLRELPRNVIVTGKNYCPVCGMERGPGVVCACHQTEALEVRGDEIPSGSLYIGDDGKLYQNDDGDPVGIDAPETTLDRYRRLITLRDLAKEVLALNKDGDDATLKKAQSRLRWQWRMFTRKYEAINTPYNRRLIAGDPDGPLLWSIEDYDPDTGVATPTHFFDRRVLDAGRGEAPTDVTPEEALLITLSDRGRVDWPYISHLTGREIDDLQETLYGRVFEHYAGQWYARDAYLSGNVRQKLEEARRMADVNPRYEENVRALESVMPEPLGPEEVVVNLGAGWVPEPDVAMFITELLDRNSPINGKVEPDQYEPEFRWDPVTVKYVEHLGQWTVDATWSLEHSAMNTESWGTTRKTALEIIDATLNGKEVVVRDRDPVTERTFINEEETMAGRAMQEKIRKKFREWVWRDAERADRLLAIYNERFNSTVPRRYDGSHLRLPGLGATVPELRDYQLNAIWRIVQGGNHLIWHEVGLGKTLVMICAGMEMRRLGLRNKVIHAVKSNTLWDYATWFQKAYPGASLLVIDSRDLRPKKRQEMLNRIVTRDWDAVIMTHEAFRKIPLRPETFAQWLEIEIDVLTDYLQEMDRVEDRLTIKELQKARKRLEARLEDIEAETDEHRDENRLTWEDLGVDLLFVDESHMFKNLYFPTRRTRVPGVNNNDSQRAWDMFLKVQYLCRRDDDGNLLGFRLAPTGLSGRRAPGSVVFSTGTAIPNSVCELYVNQRYLQFDRLLELGIGHFDAWANLFGEDVTVIEMKPSGKGYRRNTRFIRFHNVPELLRIFGEVADTKVDDGTLGLPKPDLATGEHVPMISEPSDALLEYIDYCAHRAANLSNVDPSEDNILKVMHDATYAALDMRLVDEHAQDHPDSKINQCVENVLSIYRETTGAELAALDEPANLTQMVFLDKSTPKKEFNLYDDMKQKLVRAGVPEHEVVFIHDARNDSQKQEIFEAMNRGEIRILIGSTGKMGMGTNAQRLLVALHHLDAPWRPADIDQREGRILRQGNLNDEAWVYRYATARSFDVYRWQLLEHKAAFVAQIMKASLAERSIEDVDAPVIGFAEMKALSTGDPAVLEKTAIDTEIMQLKAERDAYRGKVRRLQYEIASLPKRIERKEQRREQYAEALAHIEATEGRPFEIFVQGEPFDERKDAGQKLLGIMGRLRVNETLIEVARFRDCWIDVRQQKAWDKPTVIVCFTENVKAEIDASEDPVGVIRRIENAFDRVKRWDTELAEEIEQLRERLPIVREAAEKPWEKAERLAELQARSQQLQEEIDERANEQQEGENKWISADDLALDDKELTRESIKVADYTVITV